MPEPVARIVFSGDSFRSAKGDPDQIANVVWLKARLGDLLAELTGWPHEIRLPLLGRSVAEMLAMQGAAPEPSLDAWAQVFWQRASADLVGAMARDLAGALVVAIEMPPVLEDALNRAGIAWIDIGVSPLRFLPDWALHLKTSAHFRLDAVRDWLLTPEETARYAAHVRAWYGPADIAGPTVVFFAQTLRDRTLIRQGRFVGVEDLDALDLAGRPLLIKPHPWQPDSDVVQALIARGGKVTDCNTYALLASPQVSVATLSSSVGREARVFGREVETLSPGVQDWAFSGVDVLRDALAPRFWSALLASAGLPVKASRARDAEWRPNRLRQTIAQQGLDSAVWENADDAVLPA